MKLKEIIDKINYLRNELGWYLPLEASVEKALWDKLKLDWNYHSSNMEGINLSFEQMQLLITKRGEISGAQVKDCNQVNGHDDAITEIKMHIKDDRPFTESFIRELHTLLLREGYYNPAITPNGEPTQKYVQLGVYKTMPNDVRTKKGLFSFASPSDTKIMMPELVNWLNTEIEKGEQHPLILCAEFHHRFVSIHPFDDGNGRMARLLSNYILMRFNYPPLIIESQEKPEYLAALQKADKGNKAELKKFFGRKLVVGIERYIKIARGENINQEGDLKKRILLLTKKVESKYMKTAKSPESMTKVIKSVYAPLLIETDKLVQDVKHLFIESSWNYFEEPKDGKIPMMPSRWDLRNILLHFVNLAGEDHSYHQFKALNWLTSFRTTEKKVDVEIAFKVYFSDFEYEIKAYVGQPMESSMFVGSMKRILETIREYNNFDYDDDNFSGFEYTVHKSTYDTFPIMTDIKKWADELGHKVVGYIERRAGLAPKEEKPKRKFPFLMRKVEN